MQDLRVCCSCCKESLLSQSHKNEGNARREPFSSWIKLVAVFLVNMLLFVPDTIFGILYDHLKERFDTTTAAIGWIAFVYQVTGSLAGVVISPFVIFYGCRPVGVISMSILALGMCLCSLAPTLTCFVVFFGIIGGIGFGGVFLVSLCIVQQCFPHNRGLATGITSVGYTLGNILAPFVMEAFLKEHTLTGALFLHGTLFVQGIAFTMLLKSPRRFIQKHKLRAPVNSRLTANPEEEPDVRGHEEYNIRERGEIYRESKDSPTLDLHGTIDQHEAETKLAGSIRAANSAIKQSAIKEMFKNMFDFSILKTVPFILLILHSFFLMGSRTGFFSHTISAAIAKGIAPENAAYLFSIMGFANLTIRLASSLILYVRHVNPLIYTCIGTALLAACGLAIALASTYEHFIICMVLLGGFEGIAMKVMPLLIVHISGVDKFARSLAILRLLSLPAPLLGAPFAGWVKDLTGSYATSFVILGLSALLSMIFAGAIYFLFRMESKQLEVRKEQDIELFGPELVPLNRH